MADKFRSLKAFKDYEERESSQQVLSSRGPAPRGGVSALKVLATVKAQAGGITVAEIAAALGTAPGAVDSALVSLVAEGLVELRGEGGEARVVAR